MSFETCYFVIHLRIKSKFKRNNIDSIAVAAHPRGANTNLLDNVEAIFLTKGVMIIMVKIFVLSGIAQTPAQGALSEIRASDSIH